MSTYDSISWLPEDLTGKATTNYVQSEKHTADTSGSMSRFVIIPAEGAFYDTDNLKVVYKTATKETVLTRDNDYRLVGVDQGRTKISSAQGGVYNFILITTVFNYDPNSCFEISYQAFGGYLSSRAYSLLLQSVKDLESKLDQEGIITADNIASNKTIADMIRNLHAISARLQYSPSVEYLAECSAGSSCTWQTIAVGTEKYEDTLDFDDPSTLQGVVYLTIYSKFLDMKVALRYDLTQKQPNTVGVFNGKVEADILYQNIYQLDTTVAKNDSTFFADGRTYIPKFRIAFDTLTGAAHKVYLQMAIASTKAQSIQMIISDSTDLSLNDLAEQYTLTADTIFQENKAYYTRQLVDTYYYLYKKANVTVGATIPADTYYEKLPSDAVLNANLVSRFELCTRTSSITPPTPDATLATTNFTHGCLALKEPFKIWEGNLNLAMIQDASYKQPTISEEYNVYDSLQLVKTALGYPAWPYCPKECLDVSVINYFIVDVYDRWEKKLLKAKFKAAVIDPFSINTSVVPKKISGNGCYFINDLGTIDIDLTLEGTRGVMSLYSKSGKSSYINKRFDLRTVYIC